MPVHAAEIKNSDAAYSTVTHTVDAEWISSIPAYVLPEEQGKQNLSAYSVSVENVVLSEDTSLSVSVEYDGSLTERSGVELPYALYNSAGEIKSGSKILTKEAGDPEHPASVAFGAALAEKVKYAGVYTDTAVFSFKVAEKTYTSKEIEADDHLFGIGKTKSEYVVAKFNEDFTEVTIFKNGEDSDGLMMDWTLSTKSPMRQYESSVRTAYVKQGVVSIGNYAFWSCDFLSQLTLPQSLMSIGNNVFSYCKSLSQLTLPQGLMSIGNNAFDQCYGLLQITIPSSVTSIGRSAFEFCNGLMQLTLQQGLTSIGSSAFYCCRNLSQVTIPSSVISIGGRAFSGCDSLTEIYVDPENTAYSSKEGVLFNKDQTELCQYPNGKPNTSYTIPDGVTIVDIGAFMLCPVLSEVIIPDGVTCIESQAFYSNHGLAQVTIPGSVESIGDYAFFDCSNLTQVTIQQGITSIDRYVFQNCRQLIQVTIPQSVTNIEDSAFTGCSSLAQIYGASNSYAQTWAESKGYTFIAQ